MTFCGLCSSPHPIQLPCMARGVLPEASSGTADSARTTHSASPWYPYATYAEYHAARAAIADVIGWGEVAPAIETARRIGEARYTACREVIVRCDAGRPSVTS